MAYILTIVHLQSSSNLSLEHWYTDYITLSARKTTVTTKLKQIYPVSVLIPQGLTFNYAFPTGSVYGFGIKRRQRTPASSESASNLKIMHKVNKAGLFHIFFGLIKF